MEKDNGVEEILNDIPGASDFKVVDNKKLPTEINFWTKVKNVLFYEIKVDLSPKQQKILKEVSDFWHQDVRDLSFKQLGELFVFKK